jgi:hypothetical protein
MSLPPAASTMTPDGINPLPLEGASLTVKGGLTAQRGQAEGAAVP